MYIQRRQHLHTYLYESVPLNTGCSLPFITQDSSLIVPTKYHPHACNRKHMPNARSSKRRHVLSAYSDPSLVSSSGGDGSLKLLRLMA